MYMHVGLGYYEKDKEFVKTVSNYLQLNNIETTEISLKHSIQAIYSVDMIVLLSTEKTYEKEEKIILAIAACQKKPAYALEPKKRIEEEIIIPIRKVIDLNIYKKSANESDKSN